ncbi:MAG TPA: hypothetical protein VEL76_32270 [Gemmataceae bacterium]|nr:hypothetical protein [Gemmataceae bacterium]
MREWHGGAEVELVRRSGRLPVGTCATVPFVLREQGDELYGGRSVCKYRLEVTLQIAGGPLPISVASLVRWQRRKRRHFQISRGAELVAFTGDVWDYALLMVRHAIEDQRTRSGHPRFRVVAVAWQDPQPDDPEGGQKPTRGKRKD